MMHLKTVYYVVNFVSTYFLSFFFLSEGSWRNFKESAYTPKPSDSPIVKSRCPLTRIQNPSEIYAVPHTM